MRQIQNMPSTPGYRNACTCGFSARKGQCARGFRNLPHTSVQRFRKCGVKPRSADQTPVLRFRDLRFCCRKSGCARRLSIFPRTSKKTAPIVSSSNNGGIRDNIQLSRKHQRAVAGKPNNDPSLSPPHVESATTVSLRTSYRNIQHSGFSEMRLLSCKLISDLEAIQLTILQMTVFL